MPPSSSRRPSHWSFAFIGCGLILLVVSFSSARETYQSWKVEEEVHGLRAHVQALEGRRLQLMDTLTRLQSPETLDKEARLRLGLQKPGEQVFVLREKNLGPTQASLLVIPDSSVVEDVSNPQKWLRYFFHPSS